MTMLGVTGTGPVRVCCGEVHESGRGVPCNDGMVACTFCFGRFPTEELADVKGSPGVKWNACRPCDRANG